MRPILAFILPLLFATTITAQKMAVKEFKMVPNDLTARVKAPVIDQKIDRSGSLKQTASPPIGGSP